MYAVDSRELAFIGSNGEGKVEEVRRVGEIGDHGRGEVEFSQILWKNKSAKLADPPKMIQCAPFCTLIWAALVLGFLFAAASSFFFMLQI